MSVPEIGAANRSASAILEGVADGASEGAPATGVVRRRLVELFCNANFMLFSAGGLRDRRCAPALHEMLVRGSEMPFAKQPVIERSSRMIVGQFGLDTFEFEGRPPLEFGWRFIPEAQGRSYATEAAIALLDRANRTFAGEFLAMIDPRKPPPLSLLARSASDLWKECVIDGYLDRLYRLELQQTCLDERSSAVDDATRDRCENLP